MQVPTEATGWLTASAVEELVVEVSPTRVVTGAGSISQLGRWARELGGQRLLLVTDSGVREAGHDLRALESFAAAGYDSAHVTVFADVTPNPTSEDVARALQVASEAAVDLIVGLGGGSAMDCAKGVNFLLTNGGAIEDYWGVDKASQPMLPMIAVPTTAGTGSEAQSFALIANPATHMKMACGDKKAACRVAILDAELTVTMPAVVTATTGIDAISHALETAVTTRRNDVSAVLSREAWKMLAAAFPRVVRNGGDLTARERMLYGAHLAGAAIEQSMLGATHALANPLSARYGLTHGIAIGIMLPHVIRYNAQVVEDLYAGLVSDAGFDGERPAAEVLAEFVEHQRQEAGLPGSLAACKVQAENLDEMAQEASEQWTGQFNPRPVTVETLRELYLCAFSADSS